MQPPSVDLAFTTVPNSGILPQQNYDNVNRSYTSTNYEQYYSGNMGGGMSQTYNYQQSYTNTSYPPYNYGYPPHPPQQTYYPTTYSHTESHSYQNMPPPPVHNVYSAQHVYHTGYASKFKYKKMKKFKKWKW